MVFTQGISALLISDNSCRLYVFHTNIWWDTRNEICLFPQWSIKRTWQFSGVRDMSVVPPSRSIWLIVWYDCKAYNWHLYRCRKCGSMMWDHSPWLMHFMRSRRFPKFTYFLTRFSLCELNYIHSYVISRRIKPKIHLANDLYEHFVSVFCPVLFSFFFFNSFLLIDDGRWPSVVAKHYELELEGLRVYRVRPGRRQQHFDTLANGFYGAIKFVICSVRFQFFAPCFT